MLEPLVVKATRAVPRREGRSNPPDLSNEGKKVTSFSLSDKQNLSQLVMVFAQKGAHMMLLEEYISIFEEINGAGYMKVIFRLASTHSTMSSY